MVAHTAKCWGEDGLKSQEGQVWLLQTQLSQMEWICSQVAVVGCVHTICSCRSCWDGFRMALHPGKQKSAATRVFPGESGCQTCARRPAVGETIVGVGPVPAGAALFSLF